MRDALGLAILPDLAGDTSAGRGSTKVMVYEVYRHAR